MTSSVSGFGSAIPNTTTSSSSSNSTNPLRRTASLSASVQLALLSAAAAAARLQSAPAMMTQGVPLPSSSSSSSSTLRTTIPRPHSAFSYVSHSNGAPTAQPLLLSTTIPVFASNHDASTGALNRDFDDPIPSVANTSRLRVIRPVNQEESRIRGIFHSIRRSPEFSLSRSNGAYLDILSHMNELSQTEMVKLTILSLFGLVSRVVQGGVKKRGRDGQMLRRHLMSPHEDRVERISRLSKSALCAALARKMERQGSATYRDLIAYQFRMGSAFSSRAVQHLNFQRCNDEKGAVKIAKKITHLQSIDFTGACISDYLLQGIALNIQGLRRLNLSGCGAAITEEGVMIVVRSCSLRDLDLSNLERLSNEAVRRIVERLGEDLERLILRNCHPYQNYLLPETIRAIGQRCPNMQELTLPAECPGLTDAVIDELCMGCPRLRAFVLSGGIQTLITEDVMASIASHCPDLEALDVRQAADTPPDRKIGRLGISLAAQNCLFLSSLQYGAWGLSQTLSNREAVEKKFLEDIQVS